MRSREGGGKVCRTAVTEESYFRRRESVETARKGEQQANLARELQGRLWKKGVMGGGSNSSITARREHTVEGFDFKRAG